MAGHDQHSPSWTKPDDVMKFRKLKTKKRALQDRLFDCESPTKRSKRVYQKKASKSMVIGQPPPDECTLDDSTLMDLLAMSKDYPAAQPSTSSGTEVSFHTHPNGFSPLVPEIKLALASTSPPTSPIRSYLPSICSTFGSPHRLQKRRTIVPARMPVSPSFSPKSKSRGRRTGPDDMTDNEEDGEWHRNLCLDWSLKTNLKVTSRNPFGWSHNLKASEESSGISAFVRCIDIEPVVDEKKSKFPSMSSSKLDTSLGAQFHQCSLYWQHPSLPTMTLFPRDMNISFGGGVNNCSIRFEQKVIDYMHLEWIEAFRSAFQLLRARQSPFFYVCSNVFTCLFCSAGTQGDEQTQIYVTHATKGFRDALKSEGINFSMPYFMEEATKADVSRRLSSEELVDHPSSPGKDVDSDDEEPEKWFNELGISHGVRVIGTNGNAIVADQEKNKSRLVMVSGSDSLAFFNFLINSKSFLISAGGPFAGLPPTILSPIAFHGATLKTLKVKQSKIRNERNEVLHSIDMTGPILPHVMHMLCSLLTKTVQNYQIQVRTLNSTVPLNLYSNVKPVLDKIKPSIFELQNLSDCGLNKSILEIFCKCDNCHTIQKTLECRNSMFKWV